MNLMNFGREQMDSGMLDGMLKQVGINDVGTFVNQFRAQANKEAGAKSAPAQQPDLMSMGSSFLNQVRLARRAFAFRFKHCASFSSLAGR